MGIWDSITGYFTGDPIRQGAAAQAEAIRQGQANLEQQYGAGRGAMTDYYTRALDPYNQMRGTAMGGYGAYADASGAAGREGQLRAQQNFMTDPGYEFALKESLKAAQAAGAAGGVAIGNTADLSSRIAGRAAADQYGNYVSRLAPWLGQAQQTAQGLANINTGLGSGLAASYSGQGDAAMRAAMGIGEANRRGEEAGMVGGANLWNAGLGLANLGMGALGRLGGGLGGGGGNPLLGGYGPAPASPQDWQRYPGNR